MERIIKIIVSLYIVLVGPVILLSIAEVNPLPVNSGIDKENISNQLYSESLVAADRITKIPFSAGQKVQTPLLRAACSINYANNTAGAYGSSYYAGKQTVSYFDPTNMAPKGCDEVETYPFEITAFSFVLYNLGAYVWPVSLDVIIYDVDLSNDPCMGPGSELCRYSIVADQATYEYPDVGTYTFPSPCCVNGPFFIGLEYTSGVNGTTPSILFDDTDDPSSCLHWYYRNDGTGWLEWHSQWNPVPGHPMFWIDGETASSNCPDVDGRCCYGEPELQSCNIEYASDCYNRLDFISWSGNYDCTDPCPTPPLGRCCYGDPGLPSCENLYEVDCTALGDYISWNQELDCSNPCPATGRCCYGDPETPDCLEEYQTDCEGLADFLSWYDNIDCTSPCPGPLFDQSNFIYSPFWNVDVVDIDQDNNVDIIYTTNFSIQYPTGLYIAYGNGDGTFESPIKIMADYNSFVPAFVNDDDLIDIIAINSGGGSNAIAALLNLGDRNYSAIYSAYGGYSQIYGISSGYFNDDSYSDVIVPPDKVFFGNGQGYFLSSTDLGLDFYSSSIADFNNDNIDDIVVVATSYDVLIFCSDGLGSFTNTGGFEIPNMSINITTANSLADFNKDGNSDFATVIYDYGEASQIFIGFGDGNGDILYVDTLIFNGASHYLVSTDVNRDDNLDLVACNISTALEIYFGDETGVFSDHTRVAVEGGNYIFSLATGDFDRDGNPDFVAGDILGLSSVYSKLFISLLPDAPVIDNQEMMMITTGYDNVNIEVENPDTFRISRNYSTVAGFDYWRSDFDHTGGIDEAAIDYNLQYGEYKITMTPKSPITRSNKACMGIRINGTNLAYTFYNYDLGLDPSEEFVFYYTVEAVSSMSPPNGEASGALPTFEWSGLLEGGSGEDTYHFQLDKFYDFRNPLYDITDLTSPEFIPPVPLGKDSLYYWRFRINDGIEWSEYSRTMAVFIPEYICGDVDGKPGLSILDVVFIVNYKYKDGPAPIPEEAADVNNSAEVDILDVVYLINNLYKEGPDLNCP